jgi:hypothetical protein
VPDIDVDRLILLIVGVQLRSELGDRPLAYRIESEIRIALKKRLPAKKNAAPPRLAPVVISDVYYLNNEELHDRPLISIGGPGVNMVSANLAEELPTALAIENALVIQMDLEMTDPRCAIWGMDHLSTIRAVDTFLVKGYLDTFVAGVVRNLPPESVSSP